MDIEYSKGPFIRSKDNVNKIMMRLLISLIPIILFAFYKNGILLYIKGYTNFFGMFYPLIFMIIGAMSSLVGEELYFIILKKQKGIEFLTNLWHSYAFLPGLFLSLVVPINTPLAILFIGGLFASVIGKMVYGGLGYNLFNPALVGAIFIMTCYGVLIGTRGGYVNSLEIDTVSKATPLGNAKIVENISYDALIKPYDSFTNYFIGFIPGTLGEVSSVLIIIAFIYLTVTKTIKWRIPISYVLTFLLLTSIYSIISGIGIWYALFHLVSGGLLFGSVFMATDPVTSPVTVKGQILYGMLLGFITFLIRFLTGYPEGVMISILIMNVFVFLMDKIGSRIEFNKMYYLIYIILFAIMITSSVYIGSTYEVSEVTSSYKVISKSKDDGKTIYEVMQKGFGGYIKAKIVFDERQIIDIDILENSESPDRYNLIMDKKYINTLIEGQGNIDEVDTISSATITSNALKEMVQNTINDFVGHSKKDKSNIKIISESENREAKIYILEIGSFNGKLKIQVVTRNGLIRTAIPLEYNDTCISSTNKSEYYNCPKYLEDGYINELIFNQENMDSVDTVSGATISSRAIKEVLKHVKESGM